MENKGGESIVQADGLEINLRLPAVAAVLAWLIPGGGHFYQRRYGKAALYCFSILSLYVIGMVIGSGHVVYVSWDKDDWRWHYLCQVGVGIPALPAAIQYYFPDKTRMNGGPFGTDFMTKPKNMVELDNWHKGSANGFDMGCYYTMIAGLLNFLVIFDAYSGPMPVPGTAKHKSNEDKP